MMKSNRCRVALMLALAGACSSKSQPNTVVVTFALPIGLREATAQTIGRVDLFIDEGGSASLFSTPTTLGTSATAEGTTYQHQIADIDGDGKLEYYFSFPSNPFGYARSRSLTFSGDPSIGTFVVRANIYRANTNSLLASAKATIDATGAPISFAQAAPQVTLSFDCVPLLNCPTVVDGGLSGPIETDGGVVEGNISTVLSLPLTMSDVVRGAIDTVELVFDDTGAAALFTAATDVASSRTSDGVSFSSQLRNVDTDNGTEYEVTIRQNPFAGQTTWTMLFTGSSTIAPFHVRARLYRNDGGTLIATATATSDDAGGGFQFSASDKSVPVGFACVSAELCVTLDASAPVVEDAGEDAGVDAGADAGAEADAGAVSDAGADAGPDADAGVDAGADGGADASIDAGGDAGADAGSDAGPDAGPCANAACFLWQDAGTLTGTSPAPARPEVAVDRGGNAIAVWKQITGSRYDIWSARYDADAGRWGDAGAIAFFDAGNSDIPKIAVDWSGNGFAVWSESDGINSNGRANRFDVALGRWGDAGIICPYNNWGITNIAVAADPGGNAIALLWRNFDIQWNRFDVDAGRWGDAGAFANGDLFNVAFAATGTGIAIWDTGFSGSQVFARTWDPATLAWSASAQVSGSSTPAASPRIGFDSLGNAAAAFTQPDGIETKVWVNAYSVDAGRWGDAGPIEPYIGGIAYSPEIAVDSIGNVTVVWQQYDGVRHNVWANRFDVAAARWGNAGAIESDSNGNQGPRIGVDAFGNVTAVWQRWINGSTADISANRFVAATGLWGDAGIISSWQFGGNPRIGVAPSGKAFAVWEGWSGEVISAQTY